MFTEVERCVCCAGMTDVELDVLETCVKLSAPGFSDVLENLPTAVRFEEAAAKFSKRLHTLTVTIPIK